MSDEQLMDVGSKKEDLEKALNLTIKSTYHEDNWGVRTPVHVMSDGSRITKDEEGFWCNENSN